MPQDYDQMRNSGVDPKLIAAAIERDARNAAGNPSDMRARARIYRELYLASGRNFIFPLIAAHGAIWGCWYLLCGQMMARIMNCLDWSSKPSSKRVANFDQFIETIKVINRDVLVECFTAFYLTRTLGNHQVVKDRLASSLIDMLIGMHDASDRGKPQSIETQRQVYECFFRHEQERVAAPAIERAFNELQWPYMNRICRQPWVWFVYFRYGKSLNFEDFSKAEERIEKGLIAFDRAAALGWPAIESMLIKNPMYPNSLTFWTRCVWFFWQGTPWSKLNQRVREVRLPV